MMRLLHLTPPLSLTTHQQAFQNCQGTPLQPTHQRVAHVVSLFRRLSFTPHELSASPNRSYPLPCITWNKQRSLVQCLISTLLSHVSSQMCLQCNTTLKEDRVQVKWNRITPGTHQVSGREPLTTCSTHPAWSQCVTKAPRPETKSSMPVWSRAAAAASNETWERTLDLDESGILEHARTFTY